MLRCVISDNGVGRHMAAELKTKASSSFRSLGVNITNSRLKLIGPQHPVRPYITFEDLFDNQQPSGTRVIIDIPVVY